MVVKASRESADGIRLMLNLTKLEMEVHFPVRIESKSGAAERAYRFFVALDEQFSLAEIHDRGTSALIIQLNNPPWYSRQLKEAMKLSHDDKAFKWTAEDTWSRQTDIVDDKNVFQLINQTPVSVRKQHNSINVARWTTFRVEIKPTHHEDQTIDHFLTALADFNIRVSKNASFEVANDPEYDAHFWHLVDEISPGSCQSWSEELSMPPRLDFDLRYQLEVCISKGWLNEYLLDREFLHRLTEMSKHQAKQLLVHVDSEQTRVYDATSIFSDMRYIKPVRARKMPLNCAEIFTATVTATGIVFHTPSIEITNRIVRKYSTVADHFLRVRFEDDDYRGKTRLYPATNGKMKLIFERVRRTMLHGISLGDRHYEFLAWGNSQLREHGAWFFAASQKPQCITVDDIRRDMGIFDHEKVVAKRAARMGQCFSTTKPIRHLTKNSWRRQPIPDIQNANYNFTDGVGKISSLAAQIIHSEMKLNGTLPPSAFQFRLGGCKGVLAVDPALPGIDIRCRPSQWKFDSDSDELEIIRYSEFCQPFLNRQLILVLSALGISDSVFLRKQQACIDALNTAMTDNAVAVRTLREMVDPNLVTLSIANMIESGFSHTEEPFVSSLLQLWRAHSLKYLKQKAKIPVTKGAFVLGVADETGTLRGHSDTFECREFSTDEAEYNLPEIFMQYTDPQDGVRRVVTGVCIVARNPSLHRGDIRVVRAVDSAVMRDSRCDVVVMPSAGDRDIPSMCSGGDLDGDDYIVIWDPELIPKLWNATPFHYKAPDPVKKDRISTEDIIDFFYDYMQNDFLGRIAHAHLAAADYMENGIDNETCMRLVELHSMAVDYPKTGVPAEMTRDLERNNWPHFMEKKRALTYHSRKILGQLYDAVDEVKFEPHLSGVPDARILKYSPDSEKMEFVAELKKNYDESLRRIMAQHKIQTEFEVWSTFVLDHSKAAGDYKFHEEIGQHAKALKEQYFDDFSAEAGGVETSKLGPYAIAAYHVTNNELKNALEKRGKMLDSLEEGSDFEGIEGLLEIEMPLISFPWVLQDTLQKIARSSDFEIGGNTTMFVEEVLADLTLKGFGGEHLPDPYQRNGAESQGPEVSGDGDAAKQESLPGADTSVASALSSKTRPEQRLYPIDTAVKGRRQVQDRRPTEGRSPVESNGALSVESSEAAHDSASVASKSITPTNKSSLIAGARNSRVEDRRTMAQAEGRDAGGFRDPGTMTPAELLALTGRVDDVEEEEEFAF
jgi:RNA-dependent RNA polymerase